MATQEKYRDTNVGMQETVAAPAASVAAAENVLMHLLLVVVLLLPLPLDNRRHSGASQRRDRWRLGGRLERVPRLSLSTTGGRGDSGQLFTEEVRTHESKRRERDRE